MYTPHILFTFLFICSSSITTFAIQPLMSYSSSSSEGTPSPSPAPPPVPIPHPLMERAQPPPTLEGSPPCYSEEAPLGHAPPPYSEQNPFLDRPEEPFRTTQASNIPDSFIVQNPWYWGPLGGGMGFAIGTICSSCSICLCTASPSIICPMLFSCCCFNTLIGFCAQHTVTHAPPEIQRSCASTGNYCFHQASSYLFCERCHCQRRCHRRSHCCRQHRQQEAEEGQEMQPLGAGAVVTSQPQGRRARDNIYELTHQSRVFNTASLTTIRTMMLGATDTTIQTLKQILLKGYIPCSEDEGYTLNITPKLSRLSRPSVKKNKAYPHILQNNTKIFGFVDGYENNLNKKHKPGRVGLVVPLSTNSSVTFAYNHNSKEQRQFTNFSTHTGLKLSQVKTTLDGFSLAIVLNPYKAGPTASVAACYNFGTAKTSRFYAHGPLYSKAKGSPRVAMHGWIASVGHNIPLSTTCVITPYVETLLSMANWSSYKEKNFIPCSVSNNKEHVVETSIGLRSTLNIAPHFQIQGWVASTSGVKRLSSLQTSTDICHFSYLYNISLPKYKKNYKNIELGLGYENRIMDTLVVGITGSMYLKQLKSSKKQNLTTHINYLF